MGLGIVCLFFASKLLSLAVYQGDSKFESWLSRIVHNIIPPSHFSRKGSEGLLACNYGFVFLKTTSKQAFPERGPFFPLHWGRGVCTEGVQNSPLRFKHKHQVGRTNLFKQCVRNSPQLRTWFSWGPNCWNGLHLVLIFHKRPHFSRLWCILGVPLP